MINSDALDAHATWNARLDEHVMRPERLVLDQHLQHSERLTCRGVNDGHSFWIPSPAVKPRAVSRKSRARERGRRDAPDAQHCAELREHPVFDASERVKDTFGPDIRI